MDESERKTTPTPEERAALIKELTPEQRNAIIGGMAFDIPMLFEQEINDHGC